MSACKGYCSPFLKAFFDDQTGLNPLFNVSLDPISSSACSFEEGEIAYILIVSQLFCTRFTYSRLITGTLTQPKSILGESPLIPLNLFLLLFKIKFWCLSNLSSSFDPRGHCQGSKVAIVILPLRCIGLSTNTLNGTSAFDFGLSRVFVGPVFGKLGMLDFPFENISLRSPLNLSRQGPSIYKLFSSVWSSLSLSYLAYL